MFEIIMLFAFLYAATCQLLPGKANAPKKPTAKKSPGLPHKSSQGIKTGQWNADKAKGRSHHHALSA